MVCLFWLNDMSKADSIIVAIYNMFTIIKYKYQKPSWKIGGGRNDILIISDLIGDE